MATGILPVGNLVFLVVLFAILYSSLVTLLWLCEVTGRRHRVSPCRSACYASPWWSPTLSLRRRTREAALLFPEPWWHLTMWGSRPSHFMIIPNTKRHPNNTKTDQLPISEVITGLPRPYHNSSWFTAIPKIFRNWPEEGPEYYSIRTRGYCYSRH